MQYLSNGFEFEWSNVVFLPLINSNPSNYNTLFTVIRFVIDKAIGKSVGMKVCTITFNLPL